MAYDIRALIADVALLSRWAADEPAMHVVALTRGLALVPKPDADHDHFDDPDEEPPGLWWLPDGLDVDASARSHAGPVAYVEAEYFGGMGEQRAVVWHRGEVVLGPLINGEDEAFPADGSPISQALRRLGAERGSAFDEFDAVGMMRHSSTSAWLDEPPVPPASVLGDRVDDLLSMGDPWILPRLRMSFTETDEPIDTPVGKLGGQPVWLEAPQWPISATLGVPMTFVGQFLLPGPETRLAYLFVTDDDGDAATYAPGAGDNALLIQPGGRVPAFVRVAPHATGPSLWRRGAQWTDRVPVELAIDCAPMPEAQEQAIEAIIQVQEADRRGEQADWPEGDGPLSRTYRGGRALTWQPFLEIGSPWRFFFQLDGGEGQSDDYALNFGGGTGYAFVSPDGREGRFYWDCV